MISKEEKIQITCAELPDVVITKVTPKEVKRMGFNKVPDSLKRRTKEYDKHFLYHFNNYCYKAMRGKNLLGMMVLAPKSPKSKKDEILHLIIVNVFKPYRLQGIGSFLFVAAYGIAQSLGYKTVYIESDNDLPDSKPFCDAMVKHVKEDYNGTVQEIDLNNKEMETHE